MFTLSFFLDSQAHVGKEKASTHQRQPWTFEDPYPASCWQRQRSLLETRESRYSRDDRTIPHRSSFNSSQKWVSFLKRYATYSLLHIFLNGNVMIKNINSTWFFSGSTDSFKEGYKACLQRVSALLPKTNLDKDACQRVNEFIQQSMSTSANPACQNCCAQSSKAFPQIQQRLRSLKANLNSRVENHSHSSGSPPNRPQPVPQAVNANMWRPW